jgi:hypothetical protein
MIFSRRHAASRKVASRKPVSPVDDARRRRRRRRLALFLAIVFVGAGVTLALYPYPPLPTAEVEAARLSLQDARREAGTLAPGPLRQAATAATVMERLYAYDRSRWIRFTRLESLDQAIADVGRFAAQAVAEARSLREARTSTGRAEHEALAAQLERLRPEVEFLPPRERGARTAFARAGLSLTAAERALRDADLELLDASIDGARAEIERVQQALEARYARFKDPQWRKRWQNWADATVAASRGGKVSIVVDKLDRRLYLFRDGRLAASFDADLGRNALADKVTAGDEATPEGRYRVTEKRANGLTRWYKALMLDYPNDEDWESFRALRERGAVPPGRGPGGLIEIHGHGGKQSNWTDGCVALHNAAMDRLFAVVPVGTPVTIVGTATVAGA